MRVSSPEAYKLLHDGCIALSQIESNGIRVDTDYLKRQTKEISQKIEDMTRELKEYKEYKQWKRALGDKMVLGSREQLAHLVFTVLDYPCAERTKTGRPKADEAAFEKVNLPFVKDYLRIEKLKKAKGTYLQGIRREVVNGFLHPSFNLHTVQTFRSSSSDPNFQNVPIRNPEIGPMIRRAFVARTGRQLVEIDYKAIEVAIAACYHKDPTMIAYIKDPTKDMHRDMAAECYKLKTKEVSKEARFYAKNMFVFPQFYGDYYVHCARSLWESAQKADIRVEGSGEAILAHLKAKGITELGLCDPERRPRPGTFEHHIKKVEENFWGKRFPVYAQWKDDWYKKYRREGGFDLLTGFRVNGIFRKNEVINYPVQGAAFHCLLWSLIRLQKWLNKNKMKTLLIGQIHDSMVADAHPRELDDFIKAARRIMTQEIVKAWKWIIVPLSIEVEVAPVGGSWADKSRYQ